MSTDNTKKEDASIISILQDIKNGTLDPTLIDKGARKEIVSMLKMEGYTVSSIAAILKCSDKTVQRTVAEIRKENQIDTSPQFIKESIGDMCRSASHHCSSLIRLARNASSTTREKIDAELAAWSVMRDCIEQLRRLGYLPSSVQEITGTISHCLDNNEKSWDMIRAEVIQLEQIARQTGIFTPELEKDLLELDQKIMKGDVEEKIKNITTLNNSKKEIIEDEKDTTIERN